MARKITLRPIFPELEVEQLDLHGLDALAYLLREERESFPAYAQYHEPMKIVGRQIVVPTSDPRDYSIFIAEVGNYLVTSENGTRAVVSNPAIAGGDLSEVPAPLLAPCRGEETGDLR